MQLSILSPSLNYGHFIGDAIRSVALQSHPALEHVIVDGGSQDDTVEVLRRAPESVLWRSEPNRGQSDGLNQALSLSSGDWIGWLNVDDFYLPDAFAVLASFLESDPDVDVVYGDGFYIDVEGRFLRMQAHHSFQATVLRWYYPFVLSGAAFFRRSALPERGWDVDLRVIMDWDLYLEMESASRRFAYLPVPLGVFRKHPGQVSAQRLLPHHPEMQRLARRHGLPWARSPLLWMTLGRLERQLLKAANGGYVREIKVRRYRGADTRWFASEDALQNAHSAMARVTRPTVAARSS